MEDLRHAVSSIDKSLQTLTQLEVRHAETREALERAFTAIAKLADRIVPIEQELPTLRLARMMVFASAAVFGTAGLAAALKIIFGW